MRYAWRRSVAGFSAIYSLGAGFTCLAHGEPMWVVVVCFFNAVVFAGIFAVDCLGLVP